MDKSSYLNHYRLCIVKEGSFRLGKDADGYTLKKGDVFIVSPNTLYRASSNEENSIFYYLDFTFEDANDHITFHNLLNLKNYRHFSSMLNERQMQNLTHLDRSVEIGYPGTYLLVECMLIRILIVMLKTLKESNETYLIKDKDNAKEKLIVQCINYIDAHLSVPFAIKEMANELNYSENYIYKIFKETFQVSCKTYILDYRLNKALHELQTSSSSISDIAEMTGFSSIYHFSAAFKKKYGYSPSSLRKEI